MSWTHSVALTLLVLALLFLIGLAVSYNRFVRQRQFVDESWHGIDVELTRRHDLIPQLVETVKGYAAYEQGILTSLVAAREQAAEHALGGPSDRSVVEQDLGTALSRVLARAEAYPDLKASENFVQLQHELTNTEDRIAAARRFYNGNVRAYNSRVRTFPSNLIAGAFGFETRDFFELADPAIAAAPTVTLD